MDTHSGCYGVFHDTRACLILWRYGTGKNVLSTIMQSFFLIGVISVEFMLIGYTLIFGDDVHGIIGSLNKIGLMGTENSIMEGANIPEMAFIAFQCMFAIITPAIMSGSITGRMRFAPFVVFADLVRTHL